MATSDLLQIPGIGRTFAKDFARMGIRTIDDLRDKDPEQLYEFLCRANEKVAHKTSRNYLYVIRMAVYYANGGRDKSKLKWKSGRPEF